MKNHQQLSEKERVLLTIFEEPLSEAKGERLHFQHYEERDAWIKEVREQATRARMRVLDSSDLRNYTEYKRDSLSPTYFLPNELYLMLEGSDNAPTIFEVVIARNNAFLVIEHQDRELATRLDREYQDYLSRLPVSDEDRLQDLKEDNPALRKYLEQGKK